MANNDRLLNDLFAAYKTEQSTPESNVELEIRFKDINRESFEDLYKSLSNNPSFDKGVLECSVNIISENVFERNAGGKTDAARYLRQIIFNKSDVVGEKYIRKTRIKRSVNVPDYINYSVGLAREDIINKFAASPNALVRFKIRVSFRLANKWRFDITAIKHGLLSELSNLGVIKKSLFTPALGVDNFLQELNFAAIDDYEVEIEHIGADHDLTIDDLNVVKHLFKSINPQYLGEVAYQEEVHHAASFIVPPNILHLYKTPSYRLKQLGNQVHALSKSKYYTDVYPCDGYFLGIKYDGLRCFVSINGNRCRLIKAHDMTEIILGGDDIPFTPGKITIADVEIVPFSKLKVVPKVADPNNTYLIKVFEVCVWQDLNVSQEDYITRESYIEEAVEHINTFVAPHGHRCVYVPPVRLSADNLEAGIRQVWEADYECPVDGMIFTEPNKSYLATRNYKWKPYSHNTIDFLAMKCPQKLLGVEPYVVKPDMTLYLLFVGIKPEVRQKLGLSFIPHYRSMFEDVERDDRLYYPIQFCPSVAPLAYLYWHPTGAVDLNKKIIEMSRTEDNSEWIFHAVRADRTIEKNYFGNNFETAELVYMNYIDPFRVEELWSPSSEYFTKSASTIYSAPNRYKRFLISILIKDNFSGSKWVIDEAAGRGGDLHRYYEVGVENGLFIDISPTAIVELVRRKFEYFAEKKKQFRAQNAKPQVSWIDRARESTTVGGFGSLGGMVGGVIGGNDNVKTAKIMTVHTMVADLKTPSNELIASTFQYGINPGMIDGIVCNFALHYMCDTIEHIRNLLGFNAKMLKIGGIFVFTVMDGAKVFELLKDLKTGEQWSARENGVLKYAIKKNYVGTKLSPCGQNISVLLPFREEMLEEPLCNVDTIIAEGKKVGFAVELNESMLSIEQKFARADKDLHAKLTKDDLLYIGLHKYVSLRLIKK